LFDFATIFVVGAFVATSIVNDSIDPKKIKTSICYVVVSTNQGKAII
jgi:hypothetical protein